MPDKILSEVFSRQDRDMIITLNVKVDNIKDDIKRLGDTTVSRICTLEERTERLENWKNFVLGGVALAGIVTVLITYIYFNDIAQIKTTLERHILESK